MLVSTSDSGELRRWAGQLGARQRTLKPSAFASVSTAPPAAPSGPVRCRGVAVSPSGRLVAVALGDGSVALYRTVDGVCMRHMQGHTAAANAVAWPRGAETTLTVVSDDHTATVWDVPDLDADDRLAAPPRRTANDDTPLVQLEGHTAAVTCAAYGTRDRVLATGSNDHSTQGDATLENPRETDGGAGGGAGGRRHLGQRCAFGSSQSPRPPRSWKATRAT